MKSQYFYNLDDFMEAVLARGDNQNTEYAIHNLKYDGSYLVPWLLKNGYTCAEGRPQPKEFSILVDERNAWYTINVQVTKRRRVSILGQCKIIPYPVRIFT
jgi:hypothetical protein